MPHGHGKITRSPGKRRSKARGNIWVEIPGNARKAEKAQARIASLLAASVARRAAKVLSESRENENEEEGWSDHVEVEVVGMAGVGANGGVDNEMDSGMDSAYFEVNDASIPSITALDDVNPNDPSVDASGTRPSAAFRLTSSWKELLPTLLDSLIIYRDKTVGKLDAPLLQISSRCTTGTCILRESTIHCYSFISHQNLTVPYCECWTLPQVLVQHGLFPASPSQPQTAFSIDLLDFYQILWRYSCDAITSFSSSLALMYRRRGFTLCDQAGGMQHDPIRRRLGPAVQWFDCLQNRLDREMNHIIEECKRELDITPSSTHTPTPTTPGSATNSALPRQYQASPDQGSAPFPSFPSCTTSTPTPFVSHHTSFTTNANFTPASLPSTTTSHQPNQPLSKGECASVLQRLCPPCFGGDSFGLSFDDGGDIHVALDGNLHHRQLASAGEGVAFYESERFLSKSVVDGIGERVAAARNKPAKTRTLKVPNESIDQCRESYYAAKGDTKHTSTDIFRERGLMGLVCRHDVPLLVASIDTPGEQQKYSIALLEVLFTLLPKSATVLALYDIGCVLDRSLAMYDLLPQEYSSRLQMATSIMHAYGHQWPCQLRYNPRLKAGSGLTDGEGTERLWAALRKLIGPERQSSAARRKWLLDRALQHVAEERQLEIGAWMKSKLHNNVEVKEAEAEKILAKVRISLVDLRVYWEQQKEAQTSVRSHAPTRLRKELGKILQLQSEVDALEETISTAKHAIKHLPSASTNAMATLPQLENAHAMLKARAEELYLSLNITEGFPELNNIPFEYLQLLLLARDLKINIRKRGIGSFFEWEKLDRAVGGSDFALGTKAHQLTRKSISKRAPALQNAIKKFNQYVDRLKVMHKPSFSVPIPKPLPTTLAALRDPETSHLWEDVWIARSDCDVAPRWLVDESVRSGIRAMLTLDRCREERLRLESEANNMCRWYGRELFGIKAACSSLKYSKYKTLFSLHLQEHLQLALWWANPLLSLSRLQEEASHTCNVSRCPATPPVPLPTIPTALVSMSPDGALAGDDYEPDEIDVGEELQATSTDHYLAEILAGADGDDEEEGEEESEGEQQKVDAPNDSVQLIWAVPPDLPIDMELLPLTKTFPNWPIVGGMSASRVINTTLGIRHVFTAEELVRMDGSTRRLSSDCVNGCAAILQELLAKDLTTCGSSISSPQTARDVTIFSTYLVPKVFSEVDNAGVWRLTKSTKFWTRPKWILPIHEKEIEHWILAVIDLESGCIYLFDSMGSKKIWDDWLPKIHIVIRRLVATANGQGKKLTCPTAGWIARPLTLHQLQFNAYDCGVWILFAMTAVLRGTNVPATTERDIVEFRALLARLIRYLPQQLVSASASDGEDDFTLL